MQPMALASYPAAHIILLQDLCLLSLAAHSSFISLSYFPSFFSRRPFCSLPKKVGQLHRLASRFIVAFSPGDQYQGGIQDGVDLRNS